MIDYNSEKNNLYYISFKFMMRKNAHIVNLLFAHRKPNSK